MDQTPTQSYRAVPHKTGGVVGKTRIYKMKTLDFLNEFGIEALGRDIKIQDYPDKKMCVLNYDLILSPKADPIVAECRNLILGYREDNGKTSYRVISRSFDRFFNYGEQVVKFDFSNCWEEEKLDGSLISIYYCEQTSQWEIATRGKAFGESTLPDKSQTYRSAVLEALNLLEEEFQEIAEAVLSEYLTYIFEYTSPKNRIVTPYKEGRLTLLAIREVGWQDLVAPQQMDSVGGSLVRQLTAYQPKLKVYANTRRKVVSLAETMERVTQLTGLREGMVLVDEEGNRIKLKNSLYVKVHNLRSNGELTEKNILEMFFSGEDLEYLIYYPEDANKFDVAYQAVGMFLSGLEKEWQRLKDIKDRKAFAAEAIKIPGSGLLFGSLRDMTGPLTEFYKQPLQAKLRLFGY
jgi:T4 RnlA family RNA ligase